jgi:hypothetical protein
MSTRYTRKALQELVNYANETVPPCDGLGCAVRFTPVSGESWQREIYWPLHSARSGGEVR